MSRGEQHVTGAELGMPGAGARQVFTVDGFRLVVAPVRREIAVTA